VLLFIGLGTFVRSVGTNYEDAVWVAGLNLLHQAYLQIAEDLDPFFVTGDGRETDHLALGYGSRRHLAEVAKSLTTTSSVVETLNLALAGSLASAVVALLGWPTALVVTLGFGSLARFGNAACPLGGSLSTLSPPRPANWSSLLPLKPGNRTL
jgi:hypothetical protein